MNGEENSQLNKQSKFRFLNPDEKRKLKELNDEILGDSKNIKFESNVDLAIQFAPLSYDTQRYNIKKLVDERMTDTLVFNSSEVREKLAQERLEAKKARKAKKKRVADVSKPQMLVTSVERNEVLDEEVFESEEIINERLAEQTAIIQRELERILRNSSITEEKKEKQIKSDVEELEELEEVKQILSIKDLDVEMPKPSKDGNPRFVDEITAIERKYLDSIQTSTDESRKRELAEEKRKHAKEFFDHNEERDVNASVSVSVSRSKSKIIYRCLIAIILLFILYISYKLIEGRNQSTSQNFEEITVSETAAETTLVSDYQAKVEIIGSNTSNQVIEIVDSNFEYLAGSNNTDDFNNYIYANLKNAQPYKDNNNLIVLFGKDDSQHFGNLKYLEDSDYYNSFEVNYTYNGTTTSYNAISYYKTVALDKKMYSAFGDVDFINFITDEIYKSMHKVKSDFVPGRDSEILTLVTFDSEKSIYHVLYLTSQK